MLRTATVPSAPAPPADQTRELTRRDYARIAAQGFVLGAAVGALEAFLWIHSPLFGPTQKESSTYHFFVPVMAVGISAIAVGTAASTNHSHLRAVPSSP